MSGRRVIRRLLHRSLQFGSRLPGLRAAIYVAEAIRFQIHREARLSLRRLVTDYPDWRTSQKNTGEPLDEAQPWLTFGAIDFLESRLDKSMRVFEYGCGGSTIFFASRAGQVCAVEHDARWSRRVIQKLEALGLRNAAVVTIEPALDPAAFDRSPRDPDAYVSSDPRFRGMSFRAYAAAIDSHGGEEFHVVLVDGRARPSCFKHAARKVAPGGMIILDNADRLHYASVGKTLAELGWEQHAYAGAGPHARRFWTTTVWIRPQTVAVSAPQGVTVV